MTDPRTSYLILTADAGFGHRSAANAIEAALKEQGVAQSDICMLNLLDNKNTPAALRESQNDYDRIVREAPNLYQAAYTASEQNIPNFIFSSSMTASFYRAAREAIKEFQPSVIISTYPLYQHALMMLRMVERMMTPVICVVTDLATVHRIWFVDGVDALVVPTPAVRDLAIGYGVPSDRIHEFGIPVNPALTHPPKSVAALRRSLGWDPDLFTLFAVGSKRVQRLPEMLRGLNHSGLPVQLVISAGKDEELYKTLQSIEWHAPAHIYEFVEDMPSFLHAADCVMAKAGGLIVTESLAAGKPLILTELIPGQEEGNAKFVTDNGAGMLAENPLDVLEMVYHWRMNNSSMLRASAERAQMAGKPDAALRVAQLAMQYVAQKNLAKSEADLTWEGADQGVGRIGLVRPQLRAFLQRIGLVSAES